MTEDEWARVRHEASRRGERLIDLDAFRAWVCDQRADWEHQSLTIEIREATHGRSKNSLLVELASLELVASLIVWDSGEYELGVLNLRTQDDEMSPYHPVPTLKALISRIESEMQRLGIVRPSDPPADAERGVTTEGHDT